FFQAEDGIRDCLLSRGLGDVYKRQGAVRGVNVDGVVRTLLTRGLITEVTKDEESGATLYGTTPYFLERMGLNSLDDLPALAPYLPDAALLDDLVNEARP
ncbi:MAG TPA: hypothetical protein DD664_08300, partial [Janibacter terrae]|nr:hypothetical protein [Janibacter terrae]